MTIEHSACHGIKDVLINNNVAENTRFIQGAIQASTIAEIETDNRNSTATQKAGYDGVVSNLNGTNLASVAGIKTSTDGFTSVNKSISDFQAAIALAQAETRIETLVASGVTNNLLSAGFTASAIASKDEIIAIYKDGAHTREEAQEAICDLAKDTAKGFADAALKAAEDKHAVMLQAATDTARILAEVKDICCCTEKAIAADGEKTRSEIGRNESEKLRDKIANLEMLNALNRSVGNLGTAIK